MLTSTVYRKPTHTQIDTFTLSLIILIVKRGIVRCLYQRARRVTNMSENLKEEEKHLHAMVMAMQPLGQTLKSYLLKITQILSRRKV